MTQTTAAEGFSPAAPAGVEHGVDATVVEMVSQPATEETGVVELVAFDADGNPIGPVLHPCRSQRELRSLLRQR